MLGISNLKHTIICDDIPSSINSGSFPNIRRCSIHAAVELHVFIFYHMGRGGCTVSMGIAKWNVLQHSQYSENCFTNFAVVGAENVTPRRNIDNENEKNSA